MYSPELQDQDLSLVLLVVVVVVEPAVVEEVTHVTRLSQQPAGYPARVRVLLGSEI
jgi:hypothetical protein